MIRNSASLVIVIFILLINQSNAAIQLFCHSISSDS